MTSVDGNGRVAASPEMVVDATNHVVKVAACIFNVDGEQI